MRIRLQCLKCQFESLVQPDEEQFIELKDDNPYNITCGNGHQRVVFLENEKFDILFELGVNAFIDGYTRESVVGFVASLERFIELYIRMVVLKNHIPTENIDSTWKLVSSQSERQLGAYFFYYLIERKNVPPYLSNSMINFRNDVIHKGKIPKKEDVVSYGQAVLNLITRILFEMMDDKDESNYIWIFWPKTMDNTKIINGLRVPSEHDHINLPTIINKWIMDNFQELMNRLALKRKGETVTSSLVREINLQKELEGKTKSDFLKP